MTVEKKPGGVPLTVTPRLSNEKQCIPKYLDPMLGRTYPEFKFCWEPLLKI